MDTENNFKAVQELRMIAKFYAQRGFTEKAREVSGLISRIDNTHHLDDMTIDVDGVEPLDHQKSG